jgi:hypothetical protein
LLISRWSEKSKNFIILAGTDWDKLSVADASDPYRRKETPAGLRVHAACGLAKQPAGQQRPITEGPQRAGSFTLIIRSNLESLARERSARVWGFGLRECATAAWQSLSQHNYPVLQHSLAHKRASETHRASGRRAETKHRAMSERVRATPLK